MTKWPYNIPALLEIGSQGSARIDEIVAIIRDISLYPEYTHMMPDRLLLNSLASNLSGYCEASVWPSLIPKNSTRITKFDVIYIESSVKLIQVYSMNDLPLFLGYKYMSPLLAQLIKEFQYE